MLAGDRGVLLSREGARCQGRGHAGRGHSQPSAAGWPLVIRPSKQQQEVFGDVGVRRSGPQAVWQAGLSRCLMAPSPECLRCRRHPEEVLA